MGTACETQSRNPSRKSALRREMPVREKLSGLDLLGADLAVTQDAIHRRSNARLINSFGQLWQRNDAIDSAGATHCN